MWSIRVLLVAASVGLEVLALWLIFDSILMQGPAWELTAACLAFVAAGIALCPLVARVMRAKRESILSDV